MEEGGGGGEEKEEVPKEDSRLLEGQQRKGSADWDSDSFRNGSSVNIQEVRLPRRRDAMVVDLQMEDPWLHPDYLYPVPLEHPLEENVLLVFLRGFLFYLLGFLIGLPCIALLVLFALLIVPFRILGYLLTRLTCRGLSAQVVRKQHCDPWWPMHKDSYEGGLSSVVHCVATIQGQLPLEELEQLLWKKIAGVQTSGGFMKFPRFSQVLETRLCSSFRNWALDPNFNVAGHVRVLNASPQEAAEWSLKRFEDELNRLEAVPLEGGRPLWSVEVIQEFGESRCTLLVLRLHSLLVDHLCVPRLFALLNDTTLAFDVEPKLRGSSVPPLNLFVSISYRLWTWGQIFTAGPLALIVAALKPRDPLWLALDETERNGRRRSKPGARSSAGGSRLSIPPSVRSHRQMTWARVPNLERLLRAERILRSTTLELLLTFVAGSFRRYFRAHGLRHPSDLQIALPVSSREFIPIGKHNTCKFSLVPFPLPVSVEGCIPRLWEVQRALGDTLGGAYPIAFRAMRTFGDLFLPSALTRRLLLRTHKGSSCCLSFIRCSGELALGSRRIHSLLLYQPVMEEVKAMFTFVQNGHEMVVSLMVDQRFFPDPDILLTGFQNELQGLIQQLSVRMLTLSQATFLPSPLANKVSQRPVLPPKSPGQVARTKAPQRLDEDPTDRSADAQRTLAPFYVGETEEGSETLEELEELLGKVQLEMEGLRENPRGNRAEAIQKLSDLEAKMERFHRSIAERLKQDAVLAGKRPSGVDLEGSAGLEALLQPYKEEASGGMGNRRDSGFKLKRKRSKRMDSPTRLSPKPSRVWDESPIRASSSGSDRN